MPDQERISLDAAIARMKANAYNDGFRAAVAEIVDGLRQTARGYDANGTDPIRSAVLKQIAANIELTVEPPVIPE